MDPVLSLPQAAPSASTASGLAVLSGPVDPRPARRVVDDFFSAVRAESVPALERVLETSARTVTSARRPEPALASWERRFARLDYTLPGAEPLYGPSDVEVKTARDAETGDSRSLPLVPHDQEVLVRVALTGPAAGKLFASELAFLLSPGPSGYKIKELFEDFRLP